MNIKKNNLLFKDIFGQEKGVLELKRADFKIKNKKIYINNDYFNENKGFVVFYAPWCKHCLEFSTILTDLALSYMNVFPFGSVNCEDIEGGNDFLCNEFDIIKYPTLKIINNDGTLQDYIHEYTFDNLIYYININS